MLNALMLAPTQPCRARIMVCTQAATPNSVNAPRRMHGASPHAHQARLKLVLALAHWVSGHTLTWWQQCTDAARCEKLRPVKK